MEDLLTAEEAAAYLRVALRTIYKLIRQGDLPAAKILNRWRINPKDIEQFLEDSKKRRRARK